MDTVYVKEKVLWILWLFCSLMGVGLVSVLVWLMPLNTVLTFPCLLCKGFMYILYSVSSCVVVDYEATRWDVWWSIKNVIWSVHSYISNMEFIKLFV